MYPRHRLDITVADLVSGLAGCLRPQPGDELEADLLGRCGLVDHALVTLSVRSAWDLLLGALDWPADTEVLVSAITHPEMITILQAHGLRTVPVDLDPDTLGPRLDALQAAVTPRSRAVLVVQLFGGRSDLGPVLAFAERHGLLVFEDAAQAFVGPSRLPVDGVDVSFCSFGMIKTATAAGGAIMSVRDPQLLTELRRRHLRWPVQTRRSYALRLLRIAALLALGQPTAYGLFFRFCALTGLEPDVVIGLISRSFTVTRGPGPAGLARFRRRPAPALLGLLDRRIATFDQERLQRRTATGERLLAALPASVRPLGAGLLDRTHWLFPVVAADPSQLVAELRRAGLDASRSTSNLVAVAGPDGRVPTWAAQALTSVVYLPAYPELPEPALEKLIRVLAAVPDQWREPLDSAKVGPSLERRAPEV